MKARYLQILVMAGLFCTTARAGQMSAELQSKIDAISPDSTIKVWIKLPDTQMPEQLKAAVNAASNTRAGRYAEAYRRLQSYHQDRQRDLVTRLDELKQSGQCDNFKTSWLANIVEAELKVSELGAIASRGDVETVLPVPKLTLIEPMITSQQRRESFAAGVEPNLTYINAPQAWAAGFTGAGRVICSFDTGIDGDHPGLINNWKGLDGDSAAAWFDPRDNESFPHTVLGDNHGTHVMGILTGHNDNSGDTVGVALDAKWISAAVVDIVGASYIDAFEWAANPDGDPNSIDDVPDVINHSWGFSGVGCQDAFYSIIDNLEALGIVNIFAAGNFGPGAQTIANPANRALDSIDCFAIGNCNTNNPPSAVTSSSRGPSPCNGATKPNVSAPGLSIRSTTPNGLYGFSSGTSMASPHVAGLVAMLRQKNPNATVDEIKTAILTTTQTFGLSLPDNNLGWGVIDCMAALNALTSTNADPNVRVYALDHPSVSPGDIFDGSLVLQNIGASIAPVTATIISLHPFVGVTDGTASFGAIAEGDTIRAGDMLSFVVSPEAAEGTIASFDLRISNGLGYDDTSKLYVAVEPPTFRNFVTHDTGNIAFSVSNFGTYGLGNGSFFPIGGAGFKVMSGGNDLYEGGLMIGYDSLHISDGIRNVIGEPDGDFRIAPGGNIEFDYTTAGTAQKSRAIFEDSRAENPFGIIVKQLTYSFSETNYDDFVILRYLIKNTSLSTLNNIYVGLYLDWDILPALTSNSGGYDAGSQVAWMGYRNGATLTNLRGCMVLEGSIASAVTNPTSIAFYPEGFREKEKDSTMKSGFGSAATYANAQTDLLQIISAGPMTLSPGDTEIVAFALLAGSNLTELDNAAFFAQQLYDSLINDCCHEVRGDANNDNVDANILDLNFMVNRVFRGGPLPVCPEEGDCNSDGSVNILDLNVLVVRVFRGGPLPEPCAGY